MASSQRPQHALITNALGNKQKDCDREREDCPVTEEALVTNNQSSDKKALNKSGEDIEFKNDLLNKECLTSCLQFICDNLTSEEVVVHLQTNKILTRNDAHLINVEITPYKKNDKLIEFIQQRGPEAFNCFMKSLTDTGQKYIYDKLIEEREKTALREHPRLSTSSRVCSSNCKLISIQGSLRRLYSKSYRRVIPVSAAQFFFDSKEKWVNLTLKLDGDSTATEDYADLLKKAFAKADMLIIEGDPGVGKSSLMHRLAYEWTQEQSRLSDYDLVFYTEFCKLREYECKDVKELISHYMKGYLDVEDYEIFHHFINDNKCCKEHKILVLLDGYDESTLEKQCQELRDFFSSTISRPLSFNVLLTSRKGYLLKLRNHGRSIFTDIIGFTTESQRQEYISKHFNAATYTESSKNIAAVTRLLNTDANLKKLSESPLMLTFICLLHKKIVEGTEVELYMNIIWWMIDRYQTSNPNRDVPSLFDFQHDASDKFCVIENNYQYFPQLHQLGKMAMQDIFKTTFTETDLTKFHLNDVVQKVGLLKKVTRDTKIVYSFLHKTIQEFVIALTFFFSDDEPPIDFNWHVLLTTKKGCGIIPAKIQTYLNMIVSSKIIINESKKNLYFKSIKFYIEAYSKSSPLQELSSISTISLEDDAVDYISTNKLPLPQSSEEAIELVHNKAEQGDIYAQFILKKMYHSGNITIMSNKKAVKWYTKTAEQGDARAQYNLGLMFEKGIGVPQSHEKAVIWYTKSAKQGDSIAQNSLGNMYGMGRGVPQSYEEAVKWFRKSAEQGNACAQYDLGLMYGMGKGVTQSIEDMIEWVRKSAENGFAAAQYDLGAMYEKGVFSAPQSGAEAVKWFRKSAEQGNAVAQYKLAFIYVAGKGVPQSDEEAVKWLRKSAHQENAKAQYDLGFMYGKGRGVPQSDVEAVKWFRKSAEQGNDMGQCDLGYMYAKGRGVPQSNTEAAKWFRKSAQQGNETAQTCLSTLS